jgi:hypothetical protein
MRETVSVCNPHVIYDKLYCSPLPSSYGSDELAHEGTMRSTNQLPYTVSNQEAGQR